MRRSSKLIKLCANCFVCRFCFQHQNYSNYNRNEKHPPLTIANTSKTKKLKSDMGKIKLVRIEISNLNRCEIHM